MRAFPAPERDAPIPRGWVAAVAAVAIAVGLASLDNSFVQDDLSIIVRNERMYSLANWRILLSAPYWPPPWIEDLWRPVTSLALAAQYQLGGGDPGLFRVVSLALHALTAVGVLLLGRLLLPLGVAVGTALLFAVHPVHVEAMALAVGQPELLVTLLALVMVAWYLHRRWSPDGAVRVRDWGLLGVLYLLAALTKEHGLVLPGLLVAAELTLVSGALRPRLGRVGPGFGILALLGVLVVMVRSLVLGGDLVGSFTAEALDGLSIGGRALTMLAVATQWARLLLWPARLSADYSPQELVASTGFGTSEALGLVMILAGVVGAWASRRSLPVVSFGLLWIAVGIFPVSNVVVPTGVLLAERTLFLASAGVVLVVGGLASRAWRAEVAWVRVALQVGGATLMVLGAARSLQRWPVWQDETTYVLRTVEDAPRSFRTQRAHGEVLFLQGKRAEGMAAYGLALQYAPPAEAWRVRNDLARRHFEEGASALAVQQLLASRQEAPAIQETWNYLILGLLNLGEYPAALQEAEAALARGFSVEVFEDLRALANTALRGNVPAGAIRINVVRPEG